MSTRISILGTGVWGLAFGKALLSQDCRLIFWSRCFNTASEVAILDMGATAEKDFKLAIDCSDIIVIAVSSKGFSPVLRQLKPYLKSQTVVWLTKGFASESGELLCHAAADILGESTSFAAISGPSFAKEVQAGLPTMLAIATNDKQGEEGLRSCLSRPRLSLSLESDLTALCVGGAIKNIIAIAVGIVAALDLGENASAALMTRGLKEMEIICHALGGDTNVLLGLAGVGDLTLTCHSQLSRNRCLGYKIGKSVCSGSKLNSTHWGNETYEGFHATTPALNVMRKYHLETPIISAVANIIQKEQDINTTIGQLFQNA